MSQGRIITTVFRGRAQFGGRVAHRLRPISRGPLRSFHGKSKAPNPSTHASAIVAGIMAVGIWQENEHFNAHTSCQSSPKSLLKTLQSCPESADKLKGAHDTQFDRSVSAGGVNQKLAASGSFQSSYYFGYSVVDEFAFGVFFDHSWRKLKEEAEDCFLPESFIEEKFLNKRETFHIPVTIQMVLVRDMTAIELSQVFENMLLKQIHKNQGGSKTGSGTNSLKNFSGLFAANKENWEKGSTLLISRMSDGASVVVKNGDGMLGMVQSEIFCTAVFRVFLEELLNEDGKHDVIRSLKLFRRRESRRN